MKADTVLHDGAPNVGVAWVQDAFSQAELVLQALKLATVFLREGGTFVTKVFRSKDYNPLLWVFKQLFSVVEATKPPSSRNVSAEIFVVCQRFKAPKRLDPKLLDPRHVFAELQDATPNYEQKVFDPEKKKRKREGYAENDWTQHKKIAADEYIHTEDPIAILGSVNQLWLPSSQPELGDANAATRKIFPSITEPERLSLVLLDRLPETTDEIRECCKDLKRLGKKEFRNLLRWRTKVREREEFGGHIKKTKVAAEEGEEVAQVEPMDEEMAIQEELQRMHNNESSRKRKERRKENERKQKEIIRMQMHMTVPTDIGLEQDGPNGEGAMFNRKTVDRAAEAERILKGEMEAAEQEEEESEDVTSDEESDEDGDRLDRELDGLYEEYQDRRETSNAKARAKRARKNRGNDDWEGISDSGRSDDSDDQGAEQLPLRPKPSAQNPTAASGAGLSNKAALFFDQDIFQGIGNPDSDENESDEEKSDTNDQEAVDATVALNHNLDQDSSSRESSPDVISEIASEADSDAEISPVTSHTSSSHTIRADNDDDSYEVVRTRAVEEPEDPRKKNGQLDIDLITAEAMTLAQSLVTGEKTSMDVIDDGFNKYAFRDVDGLPEWFLDDEGKHSKPHRPITAAAAAAIKEKLRALNARPIKKVREAKSRKKFKAAQKLEKLKKKSAILADDDAMTEKDKAQTIAKMMSKATKKKPQQSVKLVVAKGGNRGISGRPRGVKGKYKIVDARLKKDVRAEKRIAKKKKSR